LALFARKGVDVQLRWKGRYHIDVDVVGESGNKWRFTGVYGESKSGMKENTWKLIRTLSGQSDLPWLCMGDFNEILFSHEKEGGPARAPGCMDAFRKALEDATWLTWALWVMLSHGETIGMLREGTHGSDSTGR
jgi:hypothetical protein